jgi:hypothetical protein
MMLAASPVYVFLLEHSQLLQLVRKAFLTSVAAPQENAYEYAQCPPPSATASAASPVPQSQRQFVIALLKRAQTWAKERHIAFAVVNNGWRRYDWLVPLLKAEGIDGFDAAPEVWAQLPPKETPISIPGDLHPNAAGAALIADAVWPFLRVLVETR